MRKGIFSVMGLGNAARRAGYTSAIKSRCFANEEYLTGMGSS